MSPRVFIIAEAGSNWKAGSLKEDLAMAKALVDAAAAAGADAVKFQTYRAETVYVPNAGTSDYLAASGIRESISDIFKRLAMPYEMLPVLAAHCRKRKIEFMSSAFSEEDFRKVDPFVKRHKIASYEISHAPLIAVAARSKKPLILSTGAATLEDIDWAVRYFKRCGGRGLSLLQCTAKYPAPASALNLRAIPFLAARYGVPVGLSDHSRDPFLAPVAAAALGAALIEKHFTFDNGLPGPDHKFAITTDELAFLVKAVRACEAALGAGEKKVLPEEKELKLFAQRAVQAMRDIRKGEKLLADVNIGILRPGKQRQGMHPRFLKEAAGKKARRTIKRGEGVLRSDYGPTTSFRMVHSGAKRRRRRRR